MTQKVRNLSRFLPVVGQSKRLFAKLLEERLDFIVRKVLQPGAAVFLQERLLMGQTNRDIRRQFDLLILMVGQRTIAQGSKRYLHLVVFISNPDHTLAITTDYRVLAQICVPIFKAPASLSAQRLIQTIPLHREYRLQFFAGGRKS